MGLQQQVVQFAGRRVAGPGDGRPALSLVLFGLIANFIEPGDRAAPRFEGALRQACEIARFSTPLVVNVSGQTASRSSSFITTRS
jgi:hypothetical protein